MEKEKLCGEGLKFQRLRRITGYLVGTTYTVSATDGSRTATRTVLIDENAKFGVSLAFQTYLYDEGDECTALTGGYSPQTFSTGTTGISRTKNNDSLEIDRSVTLPTTSPMHSLRGMLSWALSHRSSMTSCGQKSTARTNRNKLKEVL